MKIKGKIYWIFPAYYDTQNEEIGLEDQWFNNTFEWLFEFLNELEGLVCAIFDWDHWFVFVPNDKKEFENNLKNHDI